VDFNSYANEAYVESLISKLRLLGHTWLDGGRRIQHAGAPDAAPALDMMRVGWGCSGVSATTSLSRCSIRAPRPFAGHRLEWQACRALNVGATEMARFDGTSQAALYMIPFVPYSFWEKRPKSAGSLPGDSTGELFSKNNVMWAIDASWVPRPGWRVWGEFLMDDYSFSSDYKPDMLGYQAGGEWRRELAGKSALGLSAEFSRVNNYVYSSWHHHDFAYNNLPTGYVLGPDVLLAAGEATLEWGANWEFRVRGERLKKGEGQLGDAWDPAMGEVDASAFQGVVEQETRFAGSATYSPARWLRLEAVVGTASIDNLDHVPAPSTNDTPFRVSGRVEW
jgi:hypothetical protein